MVDRLYFEEIGLLDEGMEVYGGENVELGIRVSNSASHSWSWAIVHQVMCEKLTIIMAINGCWEQGHQVSLKKVSFGCKRCGLCI